MVRGYSVAWVLAASPSPVCIIFVPSAEGNVTPPAGGAEFQCQHVQSAQVGFSQAFLQSYFPANYHFISAAQLFRWPLNHSLLP